MDEAGDGGVGGDGASDDGAGDGGVGGDGVGGDGTDPGTGPEAVARAYYRAIDDADYDGLAAVLAPEFVHDRPDLTLEGRERFVAFMREERPRTDTVHPIDAVYRAADDDQGDASGGGATEVVVRGRLLAEDGERIVCFVDVHRVVDGTIQRLTTYAH